MILTALALHNTLMDVISSGMVKYTHLQKCILELHIPVHDAPVVAEIDAHLGEAYMRENACMLLLSVRDNTGTSRVMIVIHL